MSDVHNLKLFQVTASSLRKNKGRIPMVGRIGPEFQF